MNKIFYIIVFLFYVLMSGFSPVSGQNHFRVIADIPHLPLIDPATIATPQTGMLVFSSSDSKPMIYTGFSWESLCTTNISAFTAQDYFVVKEGIPFLPIFGNAPTGLLLSGTIYYSTTTNAVMVYNGSSWTRMVDMPTGAFSLNSGFTSGIDVKTIKLPVLNSDPSVSGLSAGAFYINAATKAIRYYTGTVWLDVSCQAVVTTLPLTDIAGYTAMSGGEVITNGSSPVTLTGICWSENIDPDTLLTTKTRIVTSGSGVGIFTSQLTGLLPKHTYHVRAYAVNGLGLVYGEDRTFTTPIVPPTIITLPVSKETSVSAESGGDIPADGGSPVTHRGIIWSSVTDPLNDQSHIITDDGSGVGYFPSTLDWLLGNTTYYVRAYAVNVAGTAYGNLVVFKTPPPVPPQLVFIVKMVSNTGNAATCTSTIMNNGGALVTERGIAYRRAGSNTVYYVPSSTKTPTDIGPFITNLTGLSQGTTYYVRGYAVNSAGIGYSKETSFVTTSLTSIVTNKPISTGGFTAESGGDISNTGYTIISARGICWDTTRDPNVGLTTKTAESVVGDGTGSYTSYLTGLNPGMTYYVRAYAINSAGVAYGNLDSLVTSTKASLTTNHPTGVTNIQAIVGGTITDDGYESVTTRGVCWSLTRNPTISYVDSLKPMGNGIGNFSDTLTNLLGSKKYYVKAYATNNVGTAYGGLDSLTTNPPALADLTLTSVTIIRGTTATSGAIAIAMGNVTSHGGALVTERGFCWNTTGNPVKTDVHISLGTGTGSYSGNMTDLVENMRYYVRAYAINAVGIVYSNSYSITVPAAGFPVVSTTDVINIDRTSATPRGNVYDDGGDAIRERGFCWSTTSGPIIGNVGVGVAISDLGSGTGGFSCTMTGLIPSSTYYVRAYAINAKGTSYGEEIQLTTFELPTITTITPTSITNAEAVSGGIISSDGGLKILESGVCWSTVNPPTIANQRLANTSGNMFVSNISGLIGSTTYYVCAYATNSIGTAYGAVESFTTQAPVAPTVLTVQPIAISPLSGVSGGNIVSSGGSPVTSYGVYWSTVLNFSPTISDSHTTHFGSYAGAYIDSLKNLSNNTVYYVKAYVVNAIGTSYGDEMNFQTPIPPPPATLPAVTTTTATATGANTASCGGNVLNDGGANISARGVVWSTTSGFNPNLVTVNRIYSGTGIGSFTSDPAGLTANTTYYIRAFATNSAGTSYGDEMTFTTLTIATVTTKSATEITSVGAKSGGEILSDGGIPVTSSGICWNTTGNPTISDANTGSGLGIGEFIHYLTGLMGSTTYYIRAYAVNEAGVAYGDVKTFTTLPAVVPVLVTATGKSGDNGTTGVCGGTISSNGGALITTEGIIWSTVSGFTPDINSANKTVIASGSENFASSFGPLTRGTTYYVRAYATNNAGTGYAGNEVSFTTFDIPIVITKAPYSVTNVTVNTGGDIVSDGGSTILESGMCWSTNNPPTIDDESLPAGASSSLFVKTITELMGSTTYYVRAYAKNSVGIAYGQVEVFTTQPPVLATILTIQPVATSSTTAMSGGKIISHGGSLVTTRGIYWSTVPNFVPTNAVPHTAQTGYFIGSFNDDITGLLPNTVYYVKAYVVNAAGTAYGAEMSFKTPTLATLTTAYTSSNGPTKATSGGNITDKGDSDISSRGIVWNITPILHPDTITVNRTTDGSGLGSFVSLLAGLKGNTTYYVQAYATNVAGTSYGNTISFITDPAKLATLSTVSATSVLGRTATAGGTITDNGGEPILSRGLVWSTFSNFRPDTVIYNKTLGGAMGLGSFSENMSGLRYGTTYYVRAYVTNSIGVAFGNEVSFTTINLPTLITLAVSPGATGISATGGGVLISDGGSPLINQGVCWSTSTNPTVGLYTRTSSDPVLHDSIKSNLTSLTPGTLYYVRAYAANNQGIAYGNEVSFTTPPALPALTTTYATVTSETSVLTGGIISTDNGASITQRGVVWSTIANFNPDTVVVNRTVDGIGSGTFASNIGNLKLRMFYYIRAYATNSVGTAYGNQIDITLFPTSPVLNTIEPNVITGSSAMSGGEIISDGGATVVLKGICWNTKTNPTTDHSHTYNGSGNDPFTAMLSGLAPNTLYYVRSYAINKIGTAYGVEKTILTNDIPTLAATTPATKIIATTATSGGEVTDDGRSPILSRGICWSTYPDPDISLATKTVDLTSVGIGSFVANMKGLTANRTYYVRAYATNAVGTGYGSMMQFTTLPVMLPTLTTLHPTDIDSVRATCGGNITDDGGMPITDRGICWSTSRNFTTVGSPKAFNHIRDSIGVYTDSLTGLAPGTKYYIKAFAINIKGTAYGNLDSLTTMKIRPKLGNVVMSNMTMTSGDGLASVIAAGGDSVTVRGFCWNTTGLPTIANDTLHAGAGEGSFNRTINGLVEGPIYYVRAFATNSVGTSYSPAVTSFRICPTVFTVLHAEGLNGAPVTKTVTYHSVSSSYSGAARCWLTQNLGADTLATSATDAAERAAGWYWQFNRIQGYQLNGTVRTPLTWATNIADTTNWIPANDPCNMLLGTGWRIPTSTEYTNVIANGGIPFSTPLRLHYSGYLNYGDGSPAGRSTYGIFWSSSAKRATGYGTYLQFSNGANAIYDSYKSHGFALRCLRDTVIVTNPSVSKITFTGMTQTSVSVAAAVTPDGGNPILARGFCWNTTGSPESSENPIPRGAGTGGFTSTITGLTAGIYYVRAYAVNSLGLFYGPTVATFIGCSPAFDVQHVAGLNGAPVDKTVTYHSISSTLSGKAACWLTQNLGADSIATSVGDATEKSAGWYWQFNRIQGYKHDGTTRTPLTGWAAGINENVNWTPDNDPCNRLIGGGWRIPTSTEWANAYANGNLSAISTYSSALKLHTAGYVSGGGVYYRGTYGYEWTSTQSAPTTASSTYCYNTVGGGMQVLSKTDYALPLRCLRDTIIIAVPSVSNVLFSGMTQTSVDLSAAVTPDGGAPVTDRGFFWNTTGNPTNADHAISNGIGIGNFTSTLTGLVEGPTYYVKAYAINSAGITYSTDVNTFKICPPQFTVQHIKGIDGAPVTKTVTYHSVSSSLSGKAVCWLTQNLGADTLATSNTDATEKAAGWYWQFNRIQGYKHDGTARSPATSWISINEPSNWIPANDPCTQLLGSGWRIPTMTEWTNVLANGLANTMAFNSPLKMHLAGYLDNGTTLTRGTGIYWSSTQSAPTTGWDMYFSTGGSVTYSGHGKSQYGFSVRCLRDTVVISRPSVGIVQINTSTMTATTADASSAVASDGGATVTARGICWNTKGNPTLSDNVIPGGSGTGSFTGTINGLTEGVNYYVRAYATNSAGTAYSEGTGFATVLASICPDTFNIQHTLGFRGVPVTKKVTYHAVSTYLSGAAKCWITQNLGADTLAISATDASEKAAGWYFQFNHSLGYKNDGTTTTPTAWITGFNEACDWTAINDPCNIMLGADWRLPTSTEWTNATGAPQNWATSSDAFNSVLKLHNAGYLVYNTGALGGRGTQGNYWGSVGSATTTAYDLQINTASAVISHDKAYGFSVRCLREGVVKMPPTLSNVILPAATMTDSTAQGSASILLNGGFAVTEHGFCWNTTGNPTTADNKIVVNSADTAFIGTLQGLKEGMSYYVKAYAINHLGTGYSPTVTSFKICKSVKGIHVAGLNGAPVNKITTYKVVATELSGKLMCWLAQNLGSDTLATSSTDVTEKAAGWYWQFNSSQGYKNDGTTLTPAVTAWNPWAVSVENHDWRPENDPCNLLLGLGWRLPTSVEWTAVINNGHWTTLSPYDSPLKIHKAVYLNGGGFEVAKGSAGVYCSSTQNGAGSDYEFYYYGTTGSMISNAKSTYAWSVRCLRDTIVPSTPKLSNVELPSSSFTLTTAVGNATVTSDGGSAITERGICWNTTGNPTTSDNHLVDSSTGTGSFAETLTGLKEGPTYYVRAYAINTKGKSYSPSVSSFKFCPSSFVVTHIAGLNGAPVTKTVTYHSVSSTLTGAARCWLTQNLGADTIAVAANDASEKASGWYWQFNSSKGYKNDGTTLTPAITVWNPWAVSTEDHDWRPENDPCNLLLGLGWRLPTITEWTAVINNGHWAYLNPFASVLKIHRAGYLNGGGLEVAKGGAGHYCSSTQNGSGSEFHLYYDGTTASITTNAKSTYAWSVRCLRDSVVLTPPTVSEAIMPTGSMTLTTADVSAIIGSDGGSAILERGFCWNTTGNPTISDNKKIIAGTELGAFNGTVSGLVESPTYYFRAYATSNNGVGYSPVITSFKICPASFIVNHAAGLNGAPVDKTITYHSVSSNLSGAARCWLTQNLGADQQPTSATDATEQASGWYWQFNSSKGYKNDGTTLTPAVTAWNPWAVSTEDHDWRPENDPCNLLLGLGWRLPTITEWTAVINNGHWAYLNPFASVLKIHRAGYLNGGGLEVAKGGAGHYCSSTQNGSGSEFHLYYDGTTASITTNAKSTYAWSVRCLRDSVVLVRPSISDATIPTATMTLTTAEATATITSDGGAAVTDRGFCWNTTGNPETKDNKISIGTGTGSFTGTIPGLKEGSTYYVRAYATNTNGTNYSSTVNSFKICPATFTVTHVAGLNGAPVDKTVVYHSVSSTLSGAARCWITQNLGADSVAVTANDAREIVAGWYWQFNSSKGYKYDGTTLTPAVTAWNPWAVPVESHDWRPENDPCNLLLGLGWRLPSYTEWSAVINNGHWAYLAPYDSPLKIHKAGYLNGGGLLTRGSDGHYCSSTQNGDGSDYEFYYTGTAGSMTTNAKSTYAWSARCLRDTLVMAIPSVTNAVISTSTMTLTTVDGTATVGSDGGSSVSERGFCWNTTGNPTTTDSKMIIGSGLGFFNGTILNLKEGPTYYLRAYAINNNGIGYSPIVTSFKICPPSFVVTHVADLNGAPISKTVTYHSVSSDLSGAARCWLTQNLGADRQPTAIADATELSSGWYWQFNSSKGYMNDGTTLTPAITAWTPWAIPVEDHDWRPENDPCNTLLGLGWRLPTSTEWSNVIANGHWAYLNPFASALMIHRAGYLNGGGLEVAKGGAGHYCSSTQNGSGSEFHLYYDGTTASITTNAKSTYAWSVRCLRDTLVQGYAAISDAALPTATMTATSANATATITLDGGTAVTERGFCWNTTGTPTTSDTKINLGAGIGTFSTTISGLTEGPTYYVRAYAINGKGPVFSNLVTSFKICPTTFSVTHIAGLNGAPVSKSVTYNSVSSTLSGAARCWLTQNLGADQQPTSATDGTEASAGWYWQFNRSRAYKHDGTTLTPTPTVWDAWITSINESADWQAANDPCNLMLGLGWRLPTYTEWNNVLTNGHFAYLNAFNSPLKLHLGGYLYGAALSSRSSDTYFWSSTQVNSTTGNDFRFQPGGSGMVTHDKAYAWPVRCLRDTLVMSPPSVSDPVIPTGSMTLTSADVSAIIGSDNGTAIQERGFCWNTTGNPTISNNKKVIAGTGLGSYGGTISGLVEGPTYYVRSYVTNSKGTGYSSAIASFKICPASFNVTHVAGLVGAPVDKTVTYHSVSSTLSGAARCWLTQNLGADQQPASAVDVSEQAAGWYWQFNSSKGYKNDGSTLTPATTAWNPWAVPVESHDWRSENDPCNLLLGLGWRLPSYSEWIAVIDNGHWSYWDPYASPLKIHKAVYLNGGGFEVAKGSAGVYCSSTQNGAGSDYEFYYLGATGSVITNAKSTYAWSVRCLRDTLVMAPVTISDAVIPTATMTATSANATATITLDGGTAVTERGFCWNTTGSSPTTGDTKINLGAGIGTFSTTISGLTEGPTYYVRAYAINGKGPAYSNLITSFKICPASFSVTHTAGVNGAPITKTVTYHSLSSALSGAARCWLTQNLGADQEATSAADATNQSSGWYWQFNRPQGFNHDGTTLTPSSAAWAGSIDENSDWSLANDPCNLLLGSGWRLPTSVEWTATINNGHWAYISPYTSPLKVHMAGYLYYGGLYPKGGSGYYQSATQSATSTANNFSFNGGVGSMVSYSKVAYGWSVRCLRD